MKSVRMALAICVGLMASMGVAQTGSATGSEMVGTVIDPGLNIHTVALWPDGAPGQQGDTPSDVPAVSVFAPRKGKANGTAVVIAPGGAYRELASDLEGREVADWFAARGITAFVLRYRMGAKYQYPVPLEDAQRAMRWVRANAEKYGIDVNRIGLMGFSAGGHLAAMESVSAGAADANATDVVDRESSRPDFVVLGYPWLNAMVPNTSGLITYCAGNPTVAGVSAERCKEFETKYNPVRFVTEQAPPTFLYITSDDQTVDVQASIDYFEALRAAKVPVEFHSFAHGAHGSGMGSGDLALDMWPALLDAWLRGQGFLGAKR